MFGKQFFFCGGNCLHHRAKVAKLMIYIQCSHVCGKQATLSGLSFLGESTDLLPKV